MVIHHGGLLQGEVGAGLTLPPGGETAGTHLDLDYCQGGERGDGGYLGLEACTYLHGHSSDCMNDWEVFSPF